MPTPLDTMAPALEAMVHRLVDSNLIGIAAWQADGSISYANEAFLRLVGYDRSDLASGAMRWTELTPPEWHNREARQAEEARRIGANGTYEREFLRKDGHRVPVLMGGAVFDGTADEGNVAFVLDLTGLKRAEQMVREREREARLVVNTIPGLVAILSPAGDVDFVNDALVDYCGQPLDAMRQWATNGTIHPADLPHVIERFTGGIAAGEPWDFEVRIRRFDGAYRWFQVRGLPLRDSDGPIARWYSLFSDIDDRRCAEQGLKQAYGRLTEAQRLSKTGSFITDVQEDKRDWSDEIFRIFEFDPATTITRQAVRDVVHPEDLAAFDAAYARSVEGGNTNVTYRIITRSGTLKHIHAVARVMERLDGRPLFIGALQDVTASKVAEEALDRARSELARVSRVTLLGTFTASIAHEINQPLSGIITNASTCLRMLDGDAPNIDGARDTARRTIRDGNRVSEVITRLRALFSKREFTLESLDLNVAIREVVVLSQGDLQRSRVALRSELAEDLPAIIGDRVQLQQVILNLLRNASDAMSDVRDRPRHLLIRTERDGDDRIRVSVRDSGVGIDPGSTDKVFEAFYTTKSHGMGIGLSVSRSIVERHGGRLWAEPNVGPGATFALSIPRRPASP